MYEYQGLDFFAPAAQSPHGMCTSFVAKGDIMQQSLLSGIHQNMKVNDNEIVPTGWKVWIDLWVLHQFPA